MVVENNKYLALFLNRVPKQTYGILAILLKNFPHTAVVTYAIKRLISIIKDFNECQNVCNQLQPNTPMEQKCCSRTSVSLDRVLQRKVSLTFV